jgi:hypothetical protein
MIRFSTRLRTTKPEYPDENRTATRTAMVAMNPTATMSITPISTPAFCWNFAHA